MPTISLRPIKKPYRAYITGFPEPQDDGRYTLRVCLNGMEYRIPNIPSWSACEKTAIALHEAIPHRRTRLSDITVAKRIRSVLLTERQGWQNARVNRVQKFRTKRQRSTWRQTNIEGFQRLTTHDGRWKPYCEWPQADVEALRDHILSVMPNVFNRDDGRPRYGEIIDPYTIGPGNCMVWPKVNGTNPYTMFYGHIILVRPFIYGYLNGFTPELAKLRIIKKWTHGCEIGCVNPTHLMVRQATISEQENERVNAERHATATADEGYVAPLLTLIYDPDDANATVEGKRWGKAEAELRALGLPSMMPFGDWIYCGMPFPPEVAYIANWFPGQQQTGQENTGASAPETIDVTANRFDFAPPAIAPTTTMLHGAEEDDTESTPEFNDDTWDDEDEPHAIARSADDFFNRALLLANSYPAYLRRYPALDPDDVYLFEDIKAAAEDNNLIFPWDTAAEYLHDVASN